MLRKIILNLHLYGGLLCFSYLILLGLSVINFNHPFAFTKSSAGVATWTRAMQVPGLARTEGGAAEAARVREANRRSIARALASFALPAPNSAGDWTTADTYHAHLVRPGVEYQIDLHPARGVATITRTRTGFWSLVRDLHGSHAVYSESLLASTWAAYTDLCTGVVLFAGISGIYLWTRRRRERRIGLIILGIAAVLSVSLMMLITING